MAALCGCATLKNMGRNSCGFIPRVYYRVWIIRKLDNAISENGSEVPSPVLEINISYFYFYSAFFYPATLHDDVVRYERVKKLAKKGYVQLQTSLGNLNLELHCDMVCIQEIVTMKIALITLLRRYFLGLISKWNIL